MGLRSVLPEMSVCEKVTVYLELGSVYSELGNSQESAKVIQSAVKEFKGTTEEHRYGGGGRGWVEHMVGEGGDGWNT